MRVPVYSGLVVGARRVLRSAPLFEHRLAPGRRTRGTSLPFVTASHARRVRLVWLLVYSQPNSERKAALWIEQLLDVEVWCPLESYRARHARKVEEKERVFFSRYLFTREPASSISLLSVPGVANLVRAADHSFARVPDRFVDQLKARAGPDGLFRCEPEADVGLRRGDRVGLNLSGHGYDELIGEFLRMRGEDRAIVLLSMFGAKRTIEVPRHKVRKVSHGA